MIKSKNGILKRIIPILLILALLAPNVTFVSAADLVDSKQTNLAEGARDAEGYIVVKTAGGLDAVRNNLNDKYRMYSNIDLSSYISKTMTARGGWNPIGMGSPYFRGVFDGNGYTVNGLWTNISSGAVNKGLFGVLYGGTVKNVIVVLDARGIIANAQAGGIAGSARNDARIENCTVIGGKVEVVAGGYAGGILGLGSGKATGGRSVTIEDCTVLDTAMSTSGNYSGGILGAVTDQAIINRSIVMNTTSTSYSYAGGLAGAMYGQSQADVAYTTGTVHTRASYAGGAVGVLYGASGLKNVISRNNVSSTNYSGGLVGTMYENATISKSAAYGNVSAKSYIAGGLVGEAIASTIENTYARGDVSGTTGVGGLVGYFSGSGTSYNKSVKNSYSSGQVTGRANYVLEKGSFCGRTGVEFRGTNYYDKDTSNVAIAYGTEGRPAGISSAYPQGKSTELMMKQDTFVGWDFETIWKIDENETYPYFDFGITRPGLEIYNENNQEVSIDKLDLEGLATDRVALTDVSYTLKNKDYPAGKVVNYFSANAKDQVRSKEINVEGIILAEGENEITVTAKNMFNLTRTETLNITYKKDEPQPSIPEIVIYNETGEKFKNRNIILTGKATDDKALKEVYYVITNRDNLSGKKVVLASISDDQTKVYDINSEIVLARGENTIEAVAVNKDGNVAKASVVLTYESDGPIDPD